MTTKNSTDDIKALLMFINCNMNIIVMILLDAYKERVSNKTGETIKQMIEEVRESVSKLLNIE